MRFVLLLAATLALAGCTSDHSGFVADPMDTGLIDGGAEAQLTFTKDGLYELHCDPHAWMLQNVTVAETGAMEAHVHILDGNETAEFRFEPTELAVGRGAVVTYHNHGRFQHTASEMSEGMVH